VLFWCPVRRYSKKDKKNNLMFDCTETFQYRRPTNQQGTLFIFGDSVTNGFYNSFTSGRYKGICNSIFSSCKSVFNWVYNTRGYWGDGVTSPREPLPDGKDYDPKRVLDDVREVSLEQPRLELP
jgi:hypothetical protein